MKDKMAAGAIWVHQDVDKKMYMLRIVCFFGFGGVTSYNSYVKALVFSFRSWGIAENLSELLTL